MLVIIKASIPNVIYNFCYMVDLTFNYHNWLIYLLRYLMNDIIGRKNKSNVRQYVVCFPNKDKCKYHNDENSQKYLTYERDMTKLY